MIRWVIPADKLKSCMDGETHYFDTKDTHQAISFNLGIKKDKQICAYVHVYLPSGYTEAKIDAHLGVLNKKKNMCLKFHQPRTWKKGDTGWGTTKFAEEMKLYQHIYNDEITFQYQIKDCDIKFDKESMLVEMYETIMKKENYGINATLRREVDKNRKESEENAKLVQTTLEEAEKLRDENKLLKQHAISHSSNGHMFPDDEPSKKRKLDEKTSEVVMTWSLLQTGLKQLNPVGQSLEQLRSMSSDLKKFHLLIDDAIVKEEHCSICMDARNNATTQCGHMFCYSCIDKIKNSTKTCPKCREVIVTIVKLF